LPTSSLPSLDAKLGEVTLEHEARVAALTARHELPTERHGHDAEQRDHDSDRSEVEHRESAEPDVGAKARDDEVGRRADQGHHASEDRAEGERHEHPPRRDRQPRRDLQRDRHEQDERADVVHHGREQRAERGDEADAGVGPRAGGQDLAHEHVDGARGLERVTQDEHRGDGDHGGMREPRERRGRRHEVQDDGGEHRRHRHDVVPELPPDEERERPREQAGEEQLVEVHGRGSMGAEIVPERPAPAHRPALVKPAARTAGSTPAKVHAQRGRSDHEP
jgi:hypothetical protein